MPEPSLKSKSNNTFDAGVCLLDNSFHNPSVHCFYYSCYQLLGYYLDCHGYTEDNIEDIINSEGSHNNIISLIKSVMAKSGYNYTELFTVFGAIKRIRKRADYKVTPVGEKEAYKTKIKTEGFKKELNDIIDRI